MLWKQNDPARFSVLHFGLSSVKLPCCQLNHLIPGTLAASLPSGHSPKSSSNGFSNAYNAEPNSPFAVIAGKCQLLNNQLEDYLRAEVRYLKRRRLIPRRTGDEHGSNATNSTTNYRGGGSSPASSAVSVFKMDTLINSYFSPAAILKVSNTRRGSASSSTSCTKSLNSA